MSDDKTRDIFITGLKNAHAMENQALSIMRPQVKRIQNYPDVAAKLEEHIRETEGQISRLDEILTSLAEENSSLKDAALSFTGSMAALGHTVAGDEILKNSMANFASEHFENCGLQIAHHDRRARRLRSNGQSIAGQPQ